MSALCYATTLCRGDVKEILFHTVSKNYLKLSDSADTIIEHYNNRVIGKTLLLRIRLVALTEETEGRHV